MAKNGPAFSRMSRKYVNAKFTEGQQVQQVAKDALARSSQKTGATLIRRTKSRDK